MNCFIDINEPLFPATSVIAEGSWTQCHGGRYGRYAWAQQHGHLLTKADLTATIECPNFKQQRPNTKSLIWHNSPGVISELLGERLITSHCFHHRREYFVPSGISTHSGYGFAFPASNSSAQTTICGLPQCLPHHHGIPHSIASNQGTHFIANEVGQWAHAPGIHWSYCIGHHHKTAS